MIDHVIYYLDLEEFRLENFFIQFIFLFWYNSRFKLAKLSELDMEFSTINYRNKSISSSDLKLQAIEMLVFQPLYPAY